MSYTGQVLSPASRIYYIAVPAFSIKSASFPPKMWGISKTSQDARGCAQSEQVSQTFDSPSIIGHLGHLVYRPGKSPAPGARVCRGKYTPPLPAGGWGYGGKMRPGKAPLPPASNMSIYRDDSGVIVPSHRVRLILLVGKAVLRRRHGNRGRHRWRGDDGRCSDGLSDRYRRGGDGGVNRLGDCDLPRCWRRL
jgi:hypothetical protein